MKSRAPWIVLFAGPMLDAPLCERERFPADMAPLATAEIALRLALLDAGPGDLALCDGACGGSLLFAEAALARGMRLELRLPFDEKRFLREAVAFAGQHWLSRYLCIRGHPRTVAYCLPDQAVPAGGNPFAEAGQWQLNAALSHGSDRVWLMTLSEGPNAFDAGSGTAQLVEAMHRYTGQIIAIDAAYLLRKTRERRHN
jgi:hypothetical protein